MDPELNSSFFLQHKVDLLKTYCHILQFHYQSVSFKVVICYICTYQVGTHCLQQACHYRAAKSFSYALHFRDTQYVLQDHEALQQSVPQNLSVTHSTTRGAHCILTNLYPNKTLMYNLSADTLAEKIYSIEPEVGKHLHFNNLYQFR